MTDDKSLESYRSVVSRTEIESQREYDRTLLTLSGGALGISFAFVNQFLGEGEPTATIALLGAWLAWSASLTMVLTSHYFSALALRKTVEQIDEGAIEGETPGGAFDTAIKWLNGLGGLAFILGVVLIVFFAFRNIG